MTYGAAFGAAFCAVAFAASGQPWWLAGVAAFAVAGIGWAAWKRRVEARRDEELAAQFAPPRPTEKERER